MFDRFTPLLECPPFRPSYSIYSSWIIHTTLIVRLVPCLRAHFLDSAHWRPHWCTQSEGRLLFLSCEICSCPREGNDSNSIIIFLLDFGRFDDVRLFTIDCSSHVRLHSHFHKTIIFPIRCLLQLLALQFGTKTRLQRWWQSAYGGPILRSSYIVNYFSPCDTDYEALTPTWFGHSCCTCKYFEPIPMIFNHALTASLSLCLTASLEWDTFPINLYRVRPPKKWTEPHRNTGYRYLITSHHACWLVSPPQWRGWLSWSGPSSLETGDIGSS